MVTAIPDEQRGERLVVFYAKNGISREELWDKLNKSALPKLWIPKRENLHAIDEISAILGSGKVDLKRVKAMALEKVEATGIIEISAVATALSNPHRWR